jgi:hypothetical protein
MDTQTIDQEYAKLQQEFQDVAATVKALADKMQAAQKGGDANAAAWLADLELIAKDVDEEQTQAKVLLLAIHGFIKDAAAQAEAHPPLYAPGHEPQPQQEEPQQVAYQQRPRGMFGGMLGGMMGGGMMGGYMGGGFAQAMEMGAGMSLGADLINSIFR